MNDKNKELLIQSLETHLDTRDKRFMFLKISFNDRLPYINLEGNSHQTALNIYYDFEKNNMLGSLIAHLNHHFDTDLYLDYLND